MEITRGTIKTPLKIVLYGPEGIGKSTFASHFPDPLFIDTEGSTRQLNVARLPAPSSWQMILQEVQYVKANPSICKTLVIDTADWAEQMCSSYVCATGHVNGIEDFGWGKGYTYLVEEFGKLLNLCSDVVDQGINVVITAHAMMRKFEQPDEMGAYDRWELKLSKKVAPMLKEWSDVLLFANYKTYVVNVDGQGAQKGKNKAQGGQRVMYTTHRPTYDAKNRFGLPDELPFEYQAISGIIPADINASNIKGQVFSEPAVIVNSNPVPIQLAKEAEPIKQPEATVEHSVSGNQSLIAYSEEETEEMNKLPKELTDLMIPEKVTPKDIRQVVSQRGYYPVDTPIQNYDPDFIAGVLIGAWPQILNAVNDARLPY